MDDFTDTLNLMTDIDYKKINTLLSDSKSQEFFNDVMRELTKNFYKERLDVNIIVPSAKASKKTFYDNLKNFISPSQQYEEISLFNDYITTDALDLAITEVSLEEQFMKEVDGCGESEGLLDKIYNKITELDIQLENMGSSLENKYEIIKELKDKIAKQEVVIEKISDTDEFIFVI